MDKTAIGSVGAINDPKRRQSMYEMLSDYSPNIGTFIR